MCRYGICKTIFLALIRVLLPCLVLHSIQKWSKRRTLAKPIQGDIVFTKPFCRLYGLPYNVIYIPHLHLNNNFVPAFLICYLDGQYGQIRFHLHFDIHGLGNSTKISLNKIAASMRSGVWLYRNFSLANLQASYNGKGSRIYHG